MSKGGYLGGSTIVRLGSDWFGRSEPERWNKKKRKPASSAVEGKSKALAAKLVKARQVAEAAEHAARQAEKIAEDSRQMAALAISLAAKKRHAAEQLAILLAKTTADEMLKAQADRTAAKGKQGGKASRKPSPEKQPRRRVELTEEQRAAEQERVLAIERKRSAATAHVEVVRIRAGRVVAKGVGLVREMTKDGVLFSAPRPRRPRS